MKNVNTLHITWNNIPARHDTTKPQTSSDYSPHSFWNSYRCLFLISARYFTATHLTPWGPTLVYVIFRHLYPTAKKTRRVYITEINWLTVFKEIMNIYSTKSYETQKYILEPNAELANVKRVACINITAL
jgi:hypothetical protein